MRAAEPDEPPPGDGAGPRSSADSVQDEVVALVGEAMDAFEAGGEPGLERFCAGLAQHADEVRTRLAALRRVGLLAPSPFVPDRLGDFELIEPLGRGGMGIVYRARQTSLGREVALKLVRPEQLHVPGVRERFQREIAIIARLQHEGIVRLHSFGEDNGIPWFAMERVIGCSLADVLQRFNGRDPRDLGGIDLARSVSGPGDGAQGDELLPALFEGPWTDVVVRIVERAALALDEAHRQGVLHRDLKPSNIMLTASGRVVLLDFGLAWSATADALTRSGAELGTVHYMAPEQFRGATAEIDERTDVYGLGVVLRELVTLRPVFTGNTLELVARQVREGTTAPFGPRRSSALIELETVCLVAMDRDAERRYATARGFARDLRNLLEHRPIAAVRPSLGLRLRRYLQRHPAVAAATSVALVALLAAPLVVAVRERSLRVRLQTANDALSVQIERADRNLALAADTLAATMARIDEQDVVEIPDLQGFVDAILVDAGGFLDALVDTNPSDPDARLALAETLHRAAHVRWQFFDLARTEPLFVRVLELLTQCVGDVDRLDALELDTRLSLNFVRRLRGQAAIDDYEAALASVRPVGPRAERPANVRLHLARALERCGTWLVHQADERGRAMLLEALALREANTVARPCAESWLELAISAGALSDERTWAKDAAGKDAYDELLDRALFAADEAAATGTARERESTAYALSARALTHLGQRRFDLAVRMLEAALAHWEHLIRERPSRMGPRRGWLEAGHRLAETLLAMGRRAEAELAYREVLDHTRRGLEFWPDHVRLLNVHLVVTMDLAELLHGDSERRTEAHMLLDGLSTHVDGVHTRGVTRATLLESCAVTHLVRAQFLAVEGEATRALEELSRYEEGFAHAAQFAEKDRVGLYLSSARLLIAAEAHLARGDVAGAARSLTGIPKVPEAMIAPFPRLTSHRDTPEIAAVLGAPRAP